jgi:hypothetical protein
MQPIRGIPAEYLIKQRKDMKGCPGAIKTLVNAQSLLDLKSLCKQDAPAASSK